MTTILELENDITNCESILYSAKLHYSECKYLYQPETDQEKFIVDSEPLLQSARILYWVMCIIQLCKLYSERRRDHFNFRDLLGKLMKNYSMSEWKEKISKEKIKSWQEKLNSVETKTWVKKIKELRDQYYVHSDRNPTSSYDSLFVDNREIENLLKLADEILMTIRFDALPSKYTWHVVSEGEKAKIFLKRFSHFVVKKTTSP